MENIHDELIFLMNRNELTIRGCDAQVFPKIIKHHKSATCYFTVTLMKEYNPLTLKFDLMVRSLIMLFNN